MSFREPLSKLPTHEVTNQPPPLLGYNAYDQDRALREGLCRGVARWAEANVRSLGAAVGSEAVVRSGHLANRHLPELRSHDRYGHRVDEVEYHPAYHTLMNLAWRHRAHSVAWTSTEPGGHTARAALVYLMTQVEPGVCCPLSMTSAAIPSLRLQPDLAAEWEPRILSERYDPRSMPAAEKDGATVGMAMTEKQGGSDVRANSTRARPLGQGGPGQEYVLEGHKWFCSAPMSDALLTLAQTDQGLSCFLVPRWCPDGSRNRVFVQRLKDKLGNRANASAEIEYHDAWARMVGEDGDGVRTIIRMVHQTRLDAAVAPAGLMRQAVAQATHHAAHRMVFGNLLHEQPLMRNVLADLAVESEAATVLALRVAAAFDEAREDPEAELLARLTVAVAKYWLNKRAPGHVFEALECLGGAGYVEESVMPRLYREAPLNGIWEGSGNVICLDVLRTLQRVPDAWDAFHKEVDRARGVERHLDASIDGLDDLRREASDEEQARRLVEAMARTLQGALLIQHAPASVAEAFCVSRLAGDWGHTYGTLPQGLALGDILARARPEVTEGGRG